MIEDLVDKVLEYNKHADTDLIKLAYKVADEAHEGQVRNSGEKYIVHPISVAMILAELNMDTATICAGLLHDVIEDTAYTYDELKERFGSEIAELVEGVTKLKNLHYASKKDSQAENIRKMVLAMAKDIRVIIVKLADRMHNMRTLEYKRPERQKEIAKETLEIYAPLAHRLGIWKIKWELEDLSLRYLDPEVYYEIVEKVNMRREEREQEISKLIFILEMKIQELGIESDIKGRPKNFYSIYKKMNLQNKSFEEIFDLTAMRVIVNEVKECYEILGVVHNLWKPIPGRFKDYIAMPKSNMYQSIHTTVIGESGEVFEVQIRTWDMHRTAEYGVAAHWRYKEGQSKSTEFDQKVKWVRQILEWQSDIIDPTDFVDALKVDFFSNEVFVFTPNGDVIVLPEDPTPIDFAYRIHTEVGNKCVGAKVNGRIVPLNYILETGDIVEVITSKTGTPSRDWLKIAKSSQAKSKIRQWFKSKEKEINLTKGKDILEREVKKLGVDHAKFVDDETLSKYAKSLGISSVDDLYASIGYGNITINQILSKLKAGYEEKYGVKEEIKDFTKQDRAKGKREKSGVIVKGADNLKVRFAKCCNPVPGDQIIGFITKGSGIAVHRTDCINMLNSENSDRLIPVSWNLEEEIDYVTEIQLRTLDRIGLLAAVTVAISNEGIEVLSLRTKRQGKEGVAFINLSLQVPNKETLSEILKKLKQVDGVLDAYRLK